MFLAKVFGDAMCPTIPANTYCVFRRTKAGFDPNDKIILVRDPAVRDPHVGGGWTVRRCFPGKHPTPSEGEMQYSYELLADNHAYGPMILTVSKPELDVRAEFVAVVGS
jgi:hypothetical protein